MINRENKVYMLNVVKNHSLSFTQNLRRTCSRLILLCMSHMLVTQGFVTGNVVQKNILVQYIMTGTLTINILFVCLCTFVCVMYFFQYLNVIY